MSSTAPGPGLLSPRDHARMQGVHPDLIRVVELARTRAEFFVIQGLRTREEQARKVAEGKSRTMHSRHLTGHAVDLAVWNDDGDGVVEPDELSWKGEYYRPLADAMKSAARELGVPIIWGGDWRSFFDGPHFELDRSVYP